MILKNKFGLTLTLLFLSLPLMLFAQQGIISGMVTDAKTGEPLISTNVSVVGTSFGAATNADGAFFIQNVPAGNYKLKATFMGYKNSTTKIQIVNQKIVVNFKLQPVVLAGEGIGIFANRAKDRETPVSFSEVKADKIQTMVTVQDVYHMFKHVPGVYVTSDGGSGLGDSNFLIRGFDPQRVQFNINGIPVNDPESKKVYASNWGSLAEGAQVMQIQRGVGSSMYGSGAFGGSVNISTSEAPAVKEFNLKATFGLYNTYKLGLNYNTGLLNNKIAFLAKFNYLTGNGFRKDTFYKGLQYYFALSYFPNEDHSLRFVLHGAPQLHSYSYYSMPMKNFVKYGRNFNAHPYVMNGDAALTKREKDGTNLMDVLLFGVSKDKGGEVIGNGYTSFDNNVYHKPQFEIHHSWELSDITYLQTTAFASIGRGFGENVNGYYLMARDGEDGMMTMQSIINANQYQYRAHSIHNQLGLLSTYNTKWNKHEITVGFESRYWWARHYGLMANTFGQETIGYYIGGKKANFREGDVYYDYTGIKPQISFFAHALWELTSRLKVMTDIQYSYRYYRIFEDMPSNNNRPDENGDYIITQNLKGGNNDGFINNPETKYTLLDFNKNYNFVAPKIGANYNLTSSLNVFANYSKAYNEPRVKYFYNYGQPTDVLPIETSGDTEFGFGYQGDDFFVKINGYNIDFSNKAYRIQDQTKANEPGYDYKGRRYVQVGDATYRGVEIEGSAKLTPGLDLGVSVSKMKNAWGAEISDEAKDQLGIKKGKIEPGMPQFMAHVNLDYNVGNLFVSSAFHHFQDYYVLPDNEDVIVDGKMVDGEFVSTTESATLPSWNLIDLIVGYHFGIGQYNALISLHFNNILNEEFLQIGNEYGVVPGPERNIQMNLRLGL
jgi:iron complex outermembrane recepter protein